MTVSRDDIVEPTPRETEDQDQCSASSRKGSSQAVQYNKRIKLLHQPTSRNQRPSSMDIRTFLKHSPSTAAAMIPGQVDTGGEG